MGFLKFLYMKLLHICIFVILHFEARGSRYWLNNSLFRNHSYDVRSCDTTTRPIFLPHDSSEGQEGKTVEGKFSSRV